MHVVYNLYATFLSRSTRQRARRGCWKIIIIIKIEWWEECVYARSGMNLVRWGTSSDIYTKTAMAFEVQLWDVRKIVNLREWLIENWTNDNESLENYKKNCYVTPRRSAAMHCNVNSFRFRRQSKCARSSPHWQSRVTKIHRCEFIGWDLCLRPPSLFVGSVERFVWALCAKRCKYKIQCAHLWTNSF